MLSRARMLFFIVQRPCLLVNGTELWSYIYERFEATKSFRSTLGGYKPEAAMFYAACVITALSHIHEVHALTCCALACNLTMLYFCRAGAVWCRVS